MRRFVAASIVACAAACTLITPFDDLQHDSGVDSPAVMDAQADAPADAADASIDVSIDAGLDAVVTPFCSMQDAQFCDDFDDSDASSFPKWSSVSLARGGTINRSASDASVPLGIAVKVPSWDGGSPSAYLSRVFLQPPAKYVHYAFALRVDHFPSGTSINTTAIRLGSGDDVHLSIGMNGSLLEESVPTDAGSIFPTHTLTTNLSTGKWARVEIDLAIGSPIQAKVRFDGMLVLQTALDSRHIVSTLGVWNGITYEGSVGDGSWVTMDDVVVDYQ
jgi:hypothetical protein